LWAALFKLHAALYRLSGGVLGQRVSGLPVLVLTHTGARSGTLRRTALCYCEDGMNLAVIASKGGQPENPNWYTNLMANPSAEVQVGRRRSRVRARLADETERARIWHRMASTYPGYDAYQRRTARRIPVVVLEPVTSTSYC
jgi:deazaflavin-dependent oxidoreductase (nitroreductase family)